MTAVIAVHGGAGDRSPTDERAGAAQAAVERALRVGCAVLAGGGAALDAVVAAVVVLEDDEALNAGRGAVLTSAGSVELSACVMEGPARGAGAIAVAGSPRHPVEVARQVLQEGRHVLFAGPAADELARGWGLPVEPNAYFITPARARELTGTVGAVALDHDGHLGAATSTGGVSGQQPGRVGDSPIVGAGTWADDRTCAVSATGDGDVFVRAVFAHDVHARMRYAGASLAVACAGALDEVSLLGGRGGCVAVDSAGNVAMPFTTPVMFRGWCSPGRAPWTAVGPAPPSRS